MSVYQDMADMIEILDDFVVESHELIEQLNHDLLTLESGVDEEIINQAFRAFHTIKGTSGFLGFNACMDLAHASEDLLNQIRKGERSPNTQIIDALLESTDWFTLFLKDVEQRVEGDWDILPILQTLEAASEGRPAPDHTINSATNTIPMSDVWIDIDVSQEVCHAFAAECKELLETLSNDILSLEIEPENDHLIDQIHGVFHSVLNKAETIGLQEMAAIAHKAEDVISGIRDGRLYPDTFLTDTLLKTLDYLRRIAQEADSGRVMGRNIQPLHADLDMVLNDQYGKAAKELADPVLMSRNELHPKAKSPTPATHLANDSEGNSSSSSSKRMEPTIRVALGRLDRVMNFIGELVLQRNRLNQLSSSLQTKYAGSKDYSDLESLNSSLSQITTELQESIMSMRMLPMGNVFRKYPRLVRDLGREKGRDIILEINGDDTEVDRSVIEFIGDPLVHLLRNSVDHGIEDPDVRKKLGKPPQGRIMLSACQEGSQIVIKIEDDGGGIDPQRILQRALDRELITPDEASELNPREVMNIIFKPGFTTAEKITDVSGRGVGLDVVNYNISKLNGHVDVRSEMGVGTTFTIRLPLTLTIINGMLVEVGSEKYLIPLLPILETLKIDPALLEGNSGHTMLRVHDDLIPTIYLEDLLEVPASQRTVTPAYVVVVKVAEIQVGLVVSRLLGQEEVVVKPLGQILGKINHFSGATLRGDGQVCLILDVADLVENAIPEGIAA